MTTTEPESITLVEKRIRDYVQECKRQASRGVYRSHLIGYAPPGLTQKQVKEAIAVAKRQGMYSVPDMRGLDGDTWYQYDEESEGRWR